ncbi:MAG: hypothetical protein M0R74_12435, partial [Dehalococcoidia bacterium]|nr:hypothetical protein [Dehalococcoidia bacterium]
MADRSRTVLEVQADISDISRKIAVVDKQLDQMAVNAHQGSQKIGAGFSNAGKQVAGATTRISDGSAQAMTAVTGLNWIVSDSPYFFQNMRMGIMAVSNNINPLVNNIVYLKKETGSMKNAFAAIGKQLTGPMGVVFAISIAIAAIQAISFIMGKHKAKAEGAAEANKEFKKSLEQINKVVSIDALEAQLETSHKLIVASEQDLKNKKEKMKTLQAELGLLEAQKNVGNQYSQALQTTNMQMSADQAERLKKKREEEKELQSEIDNLTQINNEEKLRIEKAETRLELLKQVEFSSEKEVSLQNRLFELRTSQLPIEEQILAWENKRNEITGDSVEDQEKRLDIDQKLLTLNEKKKKLEEEITELQKEELTGDEKIAELREKINSIDQSTLEGKKEALALEREIKNVQKSSQKARDEAEKKYLQLRSGADTESKKYLNQRIIEIEQELSAVEAGTEREKQLLTDLFNFKAQLLEKEIEQKEWQREREIQYQQQLAGIIADGGLEGIYDQMFSNIKQKVVEYWLQKLGITQAMMNMEQAIIMLGEGNIQGIRDMFHQKEMGQQAEETAAAAVGAGTKGVESASGIPFPGNLAAIGLVLASVFSALRKSKITGRQIVAAAEGAIINKPTLLLAGEALNRSGTEIVMPERNFNRYMEKEIIPGIMAKVNINNNGMESRLERVENAIYTIGRQI